MTRVRERTNPYLQLSAAGDHVRPPQPRAPHGAGATAGAFPGAVLETKIEIDTKLRESQVFGQPITSYAPKAAPPPNIARWLRN